MVLGESPRNKAGRVDPSTTTSCTELGAEKGVRTGTRLYILFVVSHMLFNFGWIPRETGSTKSVKYGFRENVILPGECYTTQGVCRGSSSVDEIGVDEGAPGVEVLDSNHDMDEDNKITFEIPTDSS